MGGVAKATIYLVQLLISLVVATQVWAWVLMLGSLWVSGDASRDLVVGLFQSVYILRFGMTAFAVALVPAAVLVIIFRSDPTGWVVPLGYVIAGATLSVLYLLQMGAFISVDSSFLVHRAPVFALGGIIGGFVFYGLSEIRFDGAFGAQGGADRIDARRRRYLASATAAVVGSAGLVSSLAGPFRIWRDSNKHLDLDVSKLAPGQPLTVVVEGTPIWIIRRTKAMIAQLAKDTAELYDPDSNRSYQPANMRNAYRSVNPEYLVAVRVCTHLGCSISYRPDGVPGLFDGRFEGDAVIFCPCHGGVYDMAGRVYKGTPPPTNLTVPDYEFISDHVIRIHYPSLAEKWDRRLN
ncbi:MAG: ubiquinol-cytochrome c reductase iron-sulfur subunit [Gammaproteobacteria bacterium]